MIDKKAVAKRFVIAHGHLMSQIGQRVTLSDLAARMSRAHGSRRFTQGLVSQYENAKVKSYPLDVIMAGAKATGVDPGWLAFGGASGAPMPPGIAHAPPAPGRILGANETPPSEEVGEFEPEEPKRKPPKRGRRKRA